MLGKYSTKITLPKTKSDLVKQINSLGRVEIRVVEPVDKKNLVSLVSLIQRAIADQGALVSIVMLKAEKTSNP